VKIVLSRKRHDPVARWVAGWVYRLGVVSGGWSSWSGAGEYERGVYINWRPRSYVLGRPRHFWFDSIRHGHVFYPIIPGEHFIDCGKCIPWPCCGSPDEGHLLTCEET